MTRPAVGMKREQYRMVQEVSDASGITRTDIVAMCIRIFVKEAIREKVWREHGVEQLELPLTDMF